MRVPLRGAQRGVAEHLLHFPQIGAAIQHVRGRGMPQGVGTDIRHSGLAGRPMHDVARRALIDASSAHAEEQRVAGPGQNRPAPSEPSLQRPLGGQSERHHTLLVPLAGDANRAVREVDVRDVHRHQFGDTDAGGIQQFENRGVALRFGGDSGVVALVCTGGCLTTIYGIGRLISCLAAAAAGRGCRSPIVLVLVCCNGMFSDIQ